MSIRTTIRSAALSSQGMGRATCLAPTRSLQRNARSCSATCEAARPPNHRPIVVDSERPTRCYRVLTHLVCRVVIRGGPLRRTRPPRATLRATHAPWHLCLEQAGSKDRVGSGSVRGWTRQEEVVRQPEAADERRMLESAERRQRNPD